jgi:predicted nucleic acid-binding protein
VILYLDSSALVKFYVEERGSAEVLQTYREAQQAATAVISRVEVSAGLAKAQRMGRVPGTDARRALDLFRKEWPRIAHVRVDEGLVARADSFAWEYGLRGYDAVHLAAGLNWQESLGLQVWLATFDEALWRAAEIAGLRAWPEGFGSG